MQWQDFFRGKRVTQMGLGLLGRGIHDAQFLSTYVAELVVTDLKNDEQLKSSVEQVSAVAPEGVVKFVLGEHVQGDFEQADFIIKGAGVPLQNEYVDVARSRGVPVYMDEALFFMLAPEALRFVGITGTRGKTTTTMLLHHILATAKQQTGEQRQIHLAGNIRDVATLPLLEVATAQDAVIAELSSWQLQGFGDIGKSPHIAIFTNFYPDHLNYYHDDMQAYFDDKAYIFSNQTSDDILIVSPEADEAIKKYYRGNIQSKYYVVDGKKYEHIMHHLRIPGAHNQQNANLAIEAAIQLGVAEKDIAETLQTFTGAPGRLEYVPNKSDVHIYNDATSTTPEAMLVALKTITEEKDGAQKAIVICGGADKGLSMQQILPKLAADGIAVITIPGSGTGALQPLLDEVGIPYVSADNLTDALRRAKQTAQEGDIILFSPGFASFGEFTNEFDRYDQFMEISKTLFGSVIK